METLIWLTEVARLNFDLQLRYRAPREIDLARLDLWAAQLIIESAAGNDAGVASDAFAIDYVRDRIIAVVPDGVLEQINSEIGRIQIALIDEEPQVAVAAAEHLRRTLGRVY
jgi:hypothetical protein